MLVNCREREVFLYLELDQSSLEGGNFQQGLTLPGLAAYLEAREAGKRKRKAEAQMYKKKTEKKLRRLEGDEEVSDISSDSGPGQQQVPVSGSLSKKTVIMTNTGQCRCFVRITSDSSTAHYLDLSAMTITIFIIKNYLVSRTGDSVVN